MNIRDFKILVANLPEEVSGEQFDLISADFEKLAETRRRVDEDELDVALARVRELQAKLGRAPDPQPAAPSPPPRRARQPEGDFTDADLGIGDEDEDGEGDMTMGSFQAELASARASGVAKRRRLS